MQRIKLGFGFWFGLVIVVVFGGLLWYMFKQDASKRDFLTNATTREIAFSCTTDMATQFHIHPVLTIIADGVQVPIPDDVGLAQGCMHPLHTHTPDGIIHVESPVQRDFTLGDFFAVWDKPFSSTELMDMTVAGGASLTMTVNDEPNTEYENLILRDHDRIVITYTSSQ